MLLDKPRPRPFEPGGISSNPPGVIFDPLASPSIIPIQIMIISIHRKGIMKWLTFLCWFSEQKGLTRKGKDVRTNFSGFFVCEFVDSFSKGGRINMFGSEVHIVLHSNVEQMLELHYLHMDRKYLLGSLYSCFLPPECCWLLWRSCWDADWVGGLSVATIVAFICVEN